MRSHALLFGDLACLCDYGVQCRACSGRARSLPAGFDNSDVDIDKLGVVSRDPGDYVGHHRRIIADTGQWAAAR